MKESFLFVICCFFLSICNAHQQKETYTTVLFNLRTGNLEISHRFYIHDAEHALAREVKANADLHQDENTRKLFAHYVVKHFALKNGINKLLPLVFVGSEIEGKYFWVYQETPIQANMDKFQVTMSVLQEVWPQQVNHINFEKNKKVRSLRLDKESHWQQVLLNFTE